MQSHGRGRAGETPATLHYFGTEVAMSLPVGNSHSLLARRSHVAPPCVATLLLVLEGREDQGLICHSTGPNLVVPHIYLCYLHR